MCVISATDELLVLHRRKSGLTFRLQSTLARPSFETNQRVGNPLKPWGWGDDDPLPKFGAVCPLRSKNYTFPKTGGKIC